MKKRLYCVLLCTICFVSCTQQADKISEYKNLDADLEQNPSGAELFLEHCAACHGMNGKLGASGAKDLSKSKLNEAHIRQMIKNGKGNMPPMGAVLGSRTAIDSVIGYTKTLRK